MEGLASYADSDEDEDAVENDAETEEVAPVSAVHFLEAPIHSSIPTSVHFRKAPIQTAVCIYVCIVAHQSVWVPADSTEQGKTEVAFRWIMRGL